MQVSVYGNEVPIEDQLKRCWLMQRTNQAVRIRRSRVHTLTVPEVQARVSKQAALKAQEYLDTQSFSRSGLMEQLLYEGFTQTQASYGVSVAY
jgi:hypothetical protein